MTLRKKRFPLIRCIKRNEIAKQIRLNWGILSDTFISINKSSETVLSIDKLYYFKPRFGMFLTHLNIFAKELKWLITSKRGERTSDSSFLVHSMSVIKDFYLVQEIFRFPWNYFWSKGNWSNFLGTFFHAFGYNTNDFLIIAIFVYNTAKHHDRLHDTLTIVSCQQWT